MIWRVYFLRTMTGQRGPLIQQSDSSPWSRELNGADLVTVTMLKSDLQGIPAEWWEPFMGGLLVTLEVDEGEEPFMATVFMDVPTETIESVTFTGDGINSLFERRLVLDEDYFTLKTTPSASDMRKLARSRVSRVGFSYGTIMQEIVKVSIDKVGGQLPIRFGTPRETGSGLRQRNYKGWNLSNIDTNKLLVELSEVINGPDFMFRPEWADKDHTLVVWTLYTGTHHQPTIHHVWTMSLDTTSPSSGATNVQVTGSKADYANRAYWTGAGEDEGTLIRAYQDVDELRRGVPLIEHVGSLSDSENASLVQNRATSHVRNNKYPRVQVSLEIDASDPRYRLDRWHVGDAAEVTVAGWLNIPDGTHMLRIIGASGSVGSDIVSIEFGQEVNDGSEI